MGDQPVDSSIGYRLRIIERKLEDIDRLKLEVQVDRLQRIEARLEAIVRMLLTLALGLIGGLGGLITALILLLTHN